MLDAFSSLLKKKFADRNHIHAKANNKYMTAYDPSKNIIYKNKETGEMIDKSLISNEKNNLDIENALNHRLYLEHMKSSILCLSETREPKPRSVKRKAIASPESNSP